MKVVTLISSIINKRSKSNHPKKTILFVEQNQDGTVGGSYHSLFYLVKALDKKKYDAVVMFYDKLDIVNKFTISGVKPIICKKPTGKQIAPPHRLLSMPYLFIQKCYNFIVVSCVPVVMFAIFIIRNHIDLVHLNNSAHTGWQWLLISKLLGRKCITHQRGFMRFGAVNKGMARYFDTIICISKAIERPLHDNNIFNTRVIYNAIDVDEFISKVKKNPQSIKQELGIKEVVPLIGLIANFQEWKGHLTVVNAIDILRRKYPGVVCLLIGAVSTVKHDREYFARVTDEIKANGLEENVLITGYRQDIPDIINALDVLIHSSIHPEPFGRVLIEGMCLGKPVIATDIGGPREIIENGKSGILIPPGDCVALSVGIEYLLENPEIGREIGRSALKQVIERFGIETFAHEINLFYEETLHEPEYAT